MRDKSQFGRQLQEVRPISPAARKYYTPEEYLEMEETAPYRSEYYRGEIFAMAGGSVNHNRISSNVNAELNIALRGKTCRVYNSAMRIRVQSVGLESYPDASVVCGEPLFVEGRNDVLTNPSLIVEVASPSTEKPETL
ncbi:MAG TPA: Uma2 family endonuclease [Chloroflexia bacterium]|nr:Uma2 family endonuclease [Chloroflexia bacterium]